MPSMLMVYVPAARIGAKAHVAIGSLLFWRFDGVCTSQTVAELASRTRTRKLRLRPRVVPLFEYCVLITSEPENAVGIVTVRTWAPLEPAVLMIPVVVTAVPSSGLGKAGHVVSSALASASVMYPNRSAMVARSSCAS